MRYHEINKFLKEDGDAAPAATSGATTSTSVATCVSPLGVYPQGNKKKKSKPVVIKRNP